MYLCLQSSSCSLYGVDGAEEGPAAPSDSAYSCAALTQEGEHEAGDLRGINLTQDQRDILHRGPSVSVARSIPHVTRLEKGESSESDNPASDDPDSDFINTFEEEEDTTDGESGNPWSDARKKRHKLAAVARQAQVKHLQAHAKKASQKKRSNKKKSHAHPTPKRQRSRGILSDMADLCVDADSDGEDENRRTLFDPVLIAPVLTNGETVIPETIDDDTQMQDQQPTQLRADELHEQLPLHHQCASHVYHRVMAEDIESCLRNMKSSEVEGRRPGAFLSGLAKLKKLWSLRGKSALANDRMHAALSRSLVTPTPTRWNSKYDSVKSFLELTDKYSLEAMNELTVKLGVAAFEGEEIAGLHDYVKVTCVNCHVVCVAF